MFGPELISQLTALFSVVLIDIVLAGDNAVVVGTAAAGLPPAQQRRVIFIGAVLALVARVALRAGRDAAAGDHRPAARRRHPAAVGGVEDLARAAFERARRGERRGGRGAAPKTMRSAIMQVAVADISMSLDNVLAVAGAARDHPYIMIFGLVLSIALMAVAAQLIARLIDRHRWIAYVGLVIVLIVAAKMIYEGGMEVLAARRRASPDAVDVPAAGVRRRRGSPPPGPRRRRTARNCSKFSSNRAGQLPRRRIVGRLVGPGRARVEQRRVDAGAGLRHAQAEHRMDRHRRLLQAAVERRVQQGARGLDRHALAGAVGAAGPAGVEQPAAGAGGAASARPACSA